MLRILLEDAGMTVEEAVSGDAALARLDDAGAERVDAVVLDQRMPAITGLEVAALIAERTPHPRMFLYSSYLSPDQEAEAARLGVTALVKSDLDQLVEALRASNGAHV